MTYFAPQMQNIQGFNPDTWSPVTDVIVITGFDLNHGILSCGLENLL